MQRDIKRLSEQEYDVLIIGGGINGAAAAWDAALRGLHVALIEKNDFGAATSSATLKLIHGGLRYLQHLDFIRMRESIRERSLMLRNAPHLVSPLSFLVPARGHGLQSRWALSAAVWANDLISLDRNRPLADPARRIPPGRAPLSSRTCRALIPALCEMPRAGGALFYDAQMYNSERLTLAFVLSAAEQGADCANYVEAIRLLLDGQRLTGARVRDMETGDTFELRAKTVVNMTGPWSDILLQLADDAPPKRDVVRSKGIQIVTPLLTGNIGLAVTSRHRDPDALFDRGGRHYFITPWRNGSLIGTTDTVYKGDPDDFRITARDIEEFVDDINSAFPPAALSPDDVTFAVGGLRPVTEKNIDTGTAAARQYEITDHARDGRAIENLISVVGVKYTTCRLLAEKVVNLVFKKLNRGHTAAATHRTRLVGGEIDSIDDFLRSALEQYAPQLGEPVVRHLVFNYGARCKSLLTPNAEGALPARLPGSAEVLESEITHAAEHESALHLSDVVMRRTDLGTLGHPGREALTAAARIMGAALNWTPDTMQREIDAVESLFIFK